MQQALDSVLRWSQKWGLKISTNKTTATIFTRKRISDPTPIKLGEHELEYVSEVKFLGVTFDSKLIWRTHIENIKQRCQRDLQLMRIISYDKRTADYETLKRIFS